MIFYQFSSCKPFLQHCPNSHYEVWRIRKVLVWALLLKILVSVSFHRCETLFRYHFLWNWFRSVPENVFLLPVSNIGSPMITVLKWKISFDKILGPSVFKLLSVRVSVCLCVCLSVRLQAVRHSFDHTNLSIHI